jgi:hypothetical protein
VGSRWVGVLQPCAVEAWQSGDQVGLPYGGLIGQQSSKPSEWGPGGPAVQSPGGAVIGGPVEQEPGGPVCWGPRGAEIWLPVSLGHVRAVALWTCRVVSWLA